MKVRIGDTIYDSNKEPIMLILSDIDKENIKNMYKDKYNFISYPSDISEMKIREWIDKKIK